MVRIGQLPCIFAAFTILSGLGGFSTDSHAQGSNRAPWDGTMLNGEKCDKGSTRFGPYDYLQRDKFPGQLSVVEDSHFDAGVESLTRGLSATPMGDIHYTIMAWPNHHRALASAVRFRLEHKELWHGGPYSAQNYPAECYLQRAIKFSPNDPVPYMLLGRLMHQMGQYETALKAYREAVRLRPTDIVTEYNMGLTLVELKMYKEAQKVSDKVYAADFPLPGLKRKLAAAKKQQGKAQVGRTKPAVPAAVTADPAKPGSASKLPMSQDDSELPTGALSAPSAAEVIPESEEHPSSAPPPSRQEALEAGTADEETAAVDQQAAGTEDAPGSPPQLTPEQLAILQQAMKEAAAKEAGKQPLPEANTP